MTPVDTRPKRVPIWAKAAERTVRQSVALPAPTATTVSTPSIRASSGMPYQGAATTRRTTGWQPSRLGPTGVLWSSIEILRARCRDEARNNPWAISAADTFQSQTVGTGIKPHWNIDDPAKKEEIEKEWRRWTRTTAFHALQATAARELFEGGEFMVRRHIRPKSWGLRIPLELQLLEAEQMPIWLNAISGAAFGAPMGNSIRCGVEFEKESNRVTAYHMYKEHPGETMFYPLIGLQYMRVPASEVFLVFEKQRAGLLRGVPRLAGVLNTLHELDKYMDASVVTKQIQTMFAGFVKKVDAGGDVIPTESLSTELPLTPPQIPWEYGVQSGKIEPGSMQILLEGEDITFPNLPQNSDIETFLRVCLHQLAVGIGITYEQLTGDLKGVNLSSIRAGILDFRRKCEQFQLNVFVSQFLHPVVTQWWLPELVLSGVVDLPGYADDPGEYEDITWRTPGWPWIDPLKDAQANQLNVRSGFGSREGVCSESGEDSATIDAQQEMDNKRADTHGLVYESDSRVMLTRGEKVSPEGAEDEGADPDAAAKDTTDENSNPGTGTPSKPGPGKPGGKPAGQPPGSGKPAPIQKGPVKKVLPIRKG